MTTLRLPLIDHEALARVSCDVCGERARCYVTQLVWRHPRFVFSCGHEACNLLALAAVSEFPEAARLWAKTGLISTTTKRVALHLVEGGKGG